MRWAQKYGNLFAQVIRSLMDGGGGVFVYEITDGLQLHDLVQLKGKATANGSKITIELVSQSGLLDGQLIDHSKRDEIPFRCVYSFDGSWELFGRFGDGRVHLFGHADYTVELDQDFSFQIVAYNNRFVMYHDEEELFALNYLVPLSNISHLALSGDASFTDIDFMESYDFLKQFHDDMFELIFGSQKDGVLETDAIETTDGIVHPIGLKQADPVAQDGLASKQAIETPLDDNREKKVKKIPKKDDDGSANLFDKLINSGLIHLQQIEAGLCERSPVPVRIGREVCIVGRLTDKCNKFYVATSTVSNKHVPKLLQGEVTIFMSVQLQPTPTYSAYLLHGPVYTELTKQTKLPGNIQAGEKFELSIRYIYKFITVLIYH